MIRNLLLVGMGGAIGSMLRYGTGLFFETKVFPLSTFFINIFGSFLIGLVAAYCLKNQAFALHWKLFLAVGICGGFTTFSAYSLENLQLLQHKRFLLFALYSSGSLLAGLAAVWLGFKIIGPS